MDADAFKIVAESILAQTMSELHRLKKKDVIRDLEMDFVYGAKLAPRLRAERALYPIESSSYKTKNFRDLYREAMGIEAYADVAMVLNLFRLLNSYKEADIIDPNDARRSFGWIYKWWWEKIIQHYSQGLQDDPDWAPHLKRHDWLLEQRS